MTLHGKQIIAGATSGEGPAAFHGYDPTSDTKLDPVFHEATQSEVDAALAAAVAAHSELRAVSAENRAGFLEAIADGIEGLGDPLLERASAETGLPMPRLTGERGRTCAQLRMFAKDVREGSWVAASIDHAIADREPLPKPDLRRMLIPIGPVVVFGASNFPLAFSVAGGDAASALAAGCPIVVKGHPNHPGTSEMVGDVIRTVVAARGLPAGTFSLVQGKEIETGASLVRHPSAKAVGFTGSLAGGRALFDIAASRPEPIPVYAEMGSTNPVFFLPSALAGEKAPATAAAVSQSVTMGVGQFCTNPGILVAQKGADTDNFRQSLAESMKVAPTGTMLHAGIRLGYDAGLTRLTETAGVQTLAAVDSGDQRCAAGPAFFATDATTWLSNPDLAEEVFGPCTLLIECEDAQQMQTVAENFAGQLTASVHGEEAEVVKHQALLQTLADVAGRVVLNGYPTGVEVCPSMQHGGPYPATTDPRSTSVGNTAIGRFARPVAFQGMPAALLPPELQDGNPRGILRLVDGNWTREPS